tara:strand:+ start:1140 stop:1343 length:204 start_codon:yes stop_codon:yes gene_type:complete
MNTRLILIAFIIFILLSVISMYMMLNGSWESYIVKLKWFLRMATPIIIILFFYIAKKEGDNDAASHS